MSYLKGVYKKERYNNLFLLFSEGHSNYWVDNFKPMFPEPWEDERFEEYMREGEGDRFWLPEEFVK